jgi:hypothetical protein
MTRVRRTLLIAIFLIVVVALVLFSASTAR